MLYWNTVNPLLKESLLTLMKAEIFSDFRLVGGTAEFTSWPPYVG